MLPRMRLPGAERAFVDPAKVRDYLLSTEHPTGRWKARFFRSLGYEATTWYRLQHDLRRLALLDRARLLRASLYGEKLQLDAMLHGPSDRAAHVVTIWIVRRGEDFPRFITAYPGFFG